MTSDTNKTSNHHFTDNGDLLLVFTKQFLNENNIKIGDDYHIQTELKKITLTPIVRLSRLKREWKKYKRRLKNSNVSYYIYRAEQCIGHLEHSGFIPLETVSKNQRFN